MTGQHWVWVIGVRALLPAARPPQDGSKQGWSGRVETIDGVRVVMAGDNAGRGSQVAARGESGDHDPFRVDAEFTGVDAHRANGGFRVFHAVERSGPVPPAEPVFDRDAPQIVFLT